jgi:hypothetical protein
MKLIHILLLVFVLLIILQNMNDAEKYTISGLTVGQYWQGLTYSPDLRMWVAVSISTTGLEYGVSGYSYDSYRWYTVDPASGGLPIQSWDAVAYGMTSNGPLFVAVAQIYNGPNLGPPGTSNYTCATSIDGITWQPNNSLPSFTAWEIHFDSVNQQFIAGGNPNAGGGGIHSSPDGINWTQTMNSIQGFATGAFCDGPNEILMVGLNLASYLPVPNSYIYDQTNPLVIFQSNGSNLPTTYLTFMFSDASYINGIYYTCNKQHAGLYSSPDGINWTQIILNGLQMNPFIVTRPQIPLAVRYFNGLYIVITDYDIYYSTDINGQFTVCYKTWKGALKPLRCESGTNINGVDRIVITCGFNSYFAALTSRDGMTWLITI